MRVLIVEDEPKLAAVIRRGLCDDGHAGDIAQDGETALWMAQATEYDTIILDLMLPGIDGIQTCRQLREAGVTSPVLMLTARTGIVDRVAGLDAGADDYLAKPFAFAELLARLRALQRRTSPARATILATGDLTLDPSTRAVSRAQTNIDLSAKEFAILEYLMRRSGEAVSRFDILEHAWDGAYEQRSNVIDAHVKSLRSKIDRPFGTQSLQTVRGVGFRLAAPT